MIITNRHNVPEHICEWLRYDEYDRHEGVVSATSLLKPVRAVVLAEKNWDKIEVDVMDLFAATCGTAIHDSFDLALRSKYRGEQRLFADIDGVRISGKFDLIVDGQLRDIKQTSVWTQIYGSRDDDYVKQLSIYAYLCKRNDVEVDMQTAWIDYIFRDWSATKAMADHNYPQLAYQAKQINLMSYEATEQWIKERLIMLEYARETLPECGKEELWYTGDIWAVMKQGRKSAVKLYRESEGETEQDARRHASQDSKLYVEFRAGEAKRCAYCNARSVCEQYRRMNNAL